MLYLALLIKIYQTVTKKKILSLKSVAVFVTRIVNDIKFYKFLYMYQLKKTHIHT